MEKPTKKCLQPGCDARISPSHLMCISHWIRAPMDVRIPVQERLHGWKSRDAAAIFLDAWIKGSFGKAWVPWA